MLQIQLNRVSHLRTQGWEIYVPLKNEKFPGIVMDKDDQRIIIDANGNVDKPDLVHFPQGTRNNKPCTL